MGTYIFEKLWHNCKQCKKRVVYFWNLDQKLMSWLYMRVNEIFDRKKVDLVF